MSDEFYTDEKFPSNKGSYKWKRPRDICLHNKFNNPKFILDGASRFDLHQGHLGDCWFVAAAATLATRPDLLKRVVPEGQTFGKSYNGKFHFKFWRYGKWIKIEIDDRLATQPKEKEKAKSGEKAKPKEDEKLELVYCSNKTTPNEFWPALLEKAYAKLLGSYEAMIGGRLENALVDFTGGIAQRISLENKSQEFFKFLLAQNNKSTLMGCTMEKAAGNEKKEKHKLLNGLVAGHTYSITSIKTVITKDGEEQLLRLRNPWGHKEWNGAWSDQKMDEGMRRKLGLEVKDDGEFWMSYQDWLKNFRAIELCHLPPDAKLEGLKWWKEIAFHGSWGHNVSYDVVLSGSQSGGGGTDKKNTVIISLMQTCARQDRVHMVLNLYEAVMPQFGCLKVKADKSKLPVKRFDPLKGDTREISDSVSLKGGNYEITASTSKKDAKGEYLLRIFTDGCVKGSK